MQVDITDADRDAFLACLDGVDRDRAIDLCFSLRRTGATLEQIVDDLLAPAQREVGRRWEHGVWSVADEHAATAITDAVLSVLAVDAAGGPPRLDGPRRHRRR